MKSVKVFIVALLAVRCVLAADLTDNDGDGLPDKWETHFGLSTNSAIGINGAFGDPDNDGLPNLAEYRAGYYVIGGEVYSNSVFALPGLCPTNARSITAGVYDAYVRPPGTNACLRQLHTDSDFLDDVWESTNGWVSVLTPDNRTLIGGRTAWDLCRLSYATRPQSLTVSVTYNRYGNSRNSTAPIVLFIYGTAAMNGHPDATVTLGNPGGWERPLTTTVINWSGVIRSGRAYVFAMLDLNNNGVWDAVEPCGVAEPSGVLFSYGRNSVSVNLTDYTDGYFRFSLNTGLRPEDLFSGKAGGGAPTLSGLDKRIIVKRSLVDSITSYQDIALDKTLRSPRTFVHEGDLFERGHLGLDWGFPDMPRSMDLLRVVYEVYLANNTTPYPEIFTNPVLTFTNKLDNMRAKAQHPDALLMAGGEGPTDHYYNIRDVVSYRPSFKWSMPLNYTAFTLEIKKSSSTGETVYNSGAVKAPARDIDGNCVWTAPVYAGMRAANGQIFSSGDTYFWRVSALNSKFNDATVSPNWSDWRAFVLKFPSPLLPSSSGSLTVVSVYAGDRVPHFGLGEAWIVTELFTDPGFSGQPAAQIVKAWVPALTNLEEGVTNSFSGLAPGDYFCRAYISVNDYESTPFVDPPSLPSLDPYEPWGYYNFLGTPGRVAFDPKSVSVPSSVPIKIIIEESDKFVPGL